MVRKLLFPVGQAAHGRVSGSKFLGIQPGAEKIGHKGNNDFGLFEAVIRDYSLSVS